MASGTIELGRDVPPGEDGWHSFTSMVDGLAAIKRRNEAQPTPAAPTMTVDEAYNTGRIHPRSVADWQQRYAVDPDATGRTLASLAPVMNASERAGPGRVWATGPDGHPVLAAVPGGRRSSSTPKLDRLMEDVYGPPEDERRRREDLQAEAELREAEQTEQQRVAAETLTDEEMRQLFPERSRRVGGGPVNGVKVTHPAQGAKVDEPSVNAAKTLPAPHRAAGGVD